MSYIVLKHRFVAETNTYFTKKKLALRLVGIASLTHLKSLLNTSSESFTSYEKKEIKGKKENNTWINKACIVLYAGCRSSAAEL